MRIQYRADYLQVNLRDRRILVCQTGFSAPYDLGRVPELVLQERPRHEGRRYPGRYPATIHWLTAWTGLRQWASDLHVVAQRADPDRGARVRGFHDKVVADGHLNVACMREYQVPWSHLRARHRDTVVDLLVRGAAQRNSGLRVGPLHEAGTIELIRSGCAPDIRPAQPRQRGAHRDPGAAVW